MKLLAILCILSPLIILFGIIVYIEGWKAALQVYGIVFAGLMFLLGTTSLGAYLWSLS